MPSSRSPLVRASALSRLRAVSAREWRDLLAALVAVGRALVLVRTRARGRLVASSAETPATGAVGPVVRQRAIALARAVDRVADAPGIGATCLVRALALQHLLAGEGIHDARVRVGVNREDGRLEAHAWVELGPLALGAPGRERRRFKSMSVVARWSA